MAGLLGMDPAELGVIMGLLQAKKGQNTTPGLLMGLAQHQAQQKQLAMREQEEAQQREMRAMQMEQMKRQSEQQQKMDALAPRFFGPAGPQPSVDDSGLPMPPVPQKEDTAGYLGAMMGVDPARALALKAQLASMQAKNYQKLGEGEKLFDMSNPAKPVAEGGQKLPTGMVMGPNGPQFMPEYVQGQQAIRAAGAPKITVENRQETEFAKALGKQQGEDYSKLMTAEAQATSKINKLSRLESLLSSSGNTGKFTPASMELKSAAESLGFKVDPKLPFQQAAQGLSNEIALELRNPSGGAGMPGALSDKDREFLTNMVPNLAKTAEGNKMLLETARKVAQRDKEVAALARAYKKQTGRFDEGFYQVLSEFSAKNPLFPQSAAPSGDGWSAQRVQ